MCRLLRRIWGRKRCSFRLHLAESGGKQGNINETILVVSADNLAGAWRRAAEILGDDLLAARPIKWTDSVVEFEARV